MLTLCMYWCSKLTLQHTMYSCTRVSHGNYTIYMHLVLVLLSVALVLSHTMHISGLVLM